MSNCERCGRPNDGRATRKFCSRACADAAKSAPLRALGDRFWEKVELTPGCWLWTGYRDRRGYGTITVDRKVTRAHRLSYEMAVGAVPDGQWVLHTCDNPSCVRPDHLFLGTHADNMADASRKGRMPGGHLAGQDHPHAKLTNAQAAEIRALCASGAKRVHLARLYGVSRDAIQKIVNGVSYASR